MDTALAALGPGQTGRSTKPGLPASVEAFTKVPGAWELSGCPFGAGTKGGRPLDWLGATPGGGPLGRLGAELPSSIAP